MIICMSDILCVTNRKLCKKNFLVRIEEIAKTSPKGIILREKDLPEEEYKKLAVDVMNICRRYGVPCILHSFVRTALELEAGAIHVPFPVLISMTEAEKKAFPILGVSCHSVEEAGKAKELGCTYIIAGHIFETDCKKGVPPRGLEFLKEVCDTIDIPVYAIGGITMDNIALVKNAGAAGGCMMSGLMR